MSARDLHAFLRVGKDFSTWIKVQIARARFLEHQDFEVLPLKGAALASNTSSPSKRPSMSP